MKYTNYGFILECNCINYTYKMLKTQNPYIIFADLGDCLLAIIFLELLRPALPLNRETYEKVLRESFEIEIV